MIGQSDDELFHDFKGGSQNAFDKIFKKYYPILCSVAYGYFRNHYLIEEIVCDVFTKIWQNRMNITINISLREYLIKAVHNNCINYYRMQKHVDRIQQEFDNQQEKIYSLFDIGQNPLQYMITKELEENILEAIEKLPSRYKETFKLSRFYGLTYADISVKMGISINSVKQNIKNSLAYLRDILSDYLSIMIILITLIRL